MRKGRSYFLKILIRLEKIYFNQRRLYVLLSTDKSKLDAYKSDCVKDDNYNIPLKSLHGLPDKPPTPIPFPEESLDFNRFLLLSGEV